MKQSKNMIAPHLRNRTRYSIEGVVDQIDHRMIRSGQAKRDAKAGAKRGKDGAWHYPPLVKG